MSKKYDILSRGLCRIPFGTVEQYKGLFMGSNTDDNEFMKHAIKDKLFMEGILCASSSLYSAIIREKEVGSFSYDTIISTLKYFIRYLTRSTPYGEFSGIGIVNFGEFPSNVQLNLPQLKTRIRIDMGWVYKFIVNLLNKDEVKNKMKFHFNCTCYILGNRLINPFFTAQGLANEIDSIRLSLNFSTQVNRVKELSINGIFYEDLISSLQNGNSNVPLDKIESFIEQLISNEILICELFPPLINIDPLEYLIEILQKRCVGSYWVTYLKDIQCLLRKYDDLCIGERSGLYLQIESSLRDVCVSKEYLQVDSQINYKNKCLGKNIEQKLEKLGNILMDLAPMDAESDYLREYKERYLEKYGYSTEVPILELLDEQIGIGAPLGYMNPPCKRRGKITEKNDMKSEYIKNLLFEKLALCQSTDGIITINDKDILKIQKKFSDTSIKNQYPISFELYLSILADTKEDLDNENYMFLFSGCEASNAAGNSFGRFSDFVNDNEQYILEISAREKIDNLITVELFEQPRNGRSANVEMTTVACQYQINSIANCNQNIKTINLKDIFIGLDNNNTFYAKAQGKKLYIKTTSMINSKYGSNAFRFLRDISTINSKIQIVQILNIFKNPGILFFPRVVYDNLILSPKCWYVSDEVWIYKGKDIEEFKKVVYVWKKKYHVPDLVNYKNMDNTLILNLNNNLHIKLLFKIYKKEKKLFFVETFANSWIQDEKENSYNNEFIFSFIRKNLTVRETEYTIKEFASKKENYNSFNRRNLLFGDEKWLYFKLYIDTARINDFIGGELLIFSNMLLKKQIIKKHFFIRYNDNKEHIRFRVQLNSNKMMEFIGLFQKWINNNREMGLIFDVSVNSYEREIERYGGIEIIEFAEEYFMMDSILIEKIYMLQNEKSINMKDEVIAVICINDLLQNWGMELSEREKWITEYIDEKKYREDFKKNERLYRSCIAHELSEENEWDKIAHLLHERAISIQNYRKAIDNAALEGYLKNQEGDILSSLIHMFCNRFKGDNIWETKVRHITRHTLHSLIGYYRYKK